MKMRISQAFTIHIEIIALKSFVMRVATTNNFPIGDFYADYVTLRIAKTFLDDKTFETRELRETLKLVFNILCYVIYESP